jgi:formylmethanofuran dehydrogenase subunit E
MKEFNFYLDQKVTTWYRTNFEVEAETLEEAKKKAIQLYKEDELNEFTWEQIDDTYNEVMTIEDNGNCSTAEIYTDDGTMIFDNTKES